MSDESRRKLLKSVAAGSGAIVAGKSLPESWSRPVVDSVLLPAHAQTSSMSYSASGVAFNENLLDMLVPQAVATETQKNICINVNGGLASVEVQYGVIYSGSASLPFDLVLSPGDINDVRITGSLDAQNNTINGDVSVGGSSTPYTAPAIPGECSLSSNCHATFVGGDIDPSVVLWNKSFNYEVFFDVYTACSCLVVLKQEIFTYGGDFLTQKTSPLGEIVPGRYKKTYALTTPTDWIPGIYNTRATLRGCNEEILGIHDQQFRVAED